MSQIRKDILTGDWVIFAANRMNKPYYFSRKKYTAQEENTDCPFCPGHEDATPKEICRVGSGEKWEVRVFKNLYPAVENEEDKGFYEDFYQGQSGKGIHEVLVDTPEHRGDISEFSPNHMLKVLKTLQCRFIEMEREPFIQYVQIFKNNGADAGASIAHSHWQIMGVSYIPIEQEKIINSIKAYNKEKSACLICDTLKQETKKGKRIVHETEEFLVFVPYAARFGFEMLIVPKVHVTSFKELDEQMLVKLGEILVAVSGKIRRIRPDLGFNLCFQDKPKDYSGPFHWYLRVLPRIGAPAGFEYATGSYINPIYPEESAKIIREI